jgi:diaminopimelate epimerase
MEKFKDKKGQVAFEYLIVTGFFLLVAGTFFIYAIVTVNSSLGSQQGNDAVSVIASNADFVASLGSGSNIVFDVVFPDNSTELQIYEKQVRLVVGSGNGASSFYAYTKASMTPTTIPVEGGKHYLKAIFLDGNVLVVAE